jgi:hypothetical protein
LADCGQHCLPRNHSRNPISKSQAFQTGFGKDNRVELLFSEFSQARFDVAADVFDDQIWPDMQKLGFAPQAARADARSFRQRLDARGDRRNKNVAGRFTQRNCSDREAVNRLRGQVLATVNGQVDALIKQRPLQLFRKEPLATDLSQRARALPRVPRRSFCGAVGIAK